MFGKLNIAATRASFDKKYHLTDLASEDPPFKVEYLGIN